MDFDKLAKEAQLVLGRMFPTVKVVAGSLFDDGEGNETEGLMIGTLFSMYQVKTVVETRTQESVTHHWTVDIHPDDDDEPIRFGTYSGPWLALGDVAAELARYQVENEAEILGLEAENLPQAEISGTTDPKPSGQKITLGNVKAECRVCGKTLEGGDEVIWVRKPSEGIHCLECAS